MPEFEYRTQLHEMWLEGTSDEKPNEEVVITDAALRGYDIVNFDAWFDTMQFIWRFHADLVFKS